MTIHDRLATLALTLLMCASCTQTPEKEPLSEDESVLSRHAAAPDQTVAYGSQSEQIADLRFGGESAQGRPLVVIVHGGFWRPAWDRAHAGPMSVALAQAGWTVATIEYRRVPGQPDLTLEDVSRAIETLPTLASRHNGKMVLIGHSAGGHLVLWAGATHRSPNIAGVLALAPAADLKLTQERNLGDGAARAFLGVDAADRPDVDPKLLPTPRAPVAIVHGALDDTVPPEIARSYIATHRTVRLVELRRAGHIGVIDPQSPAWPAVIAELEKLSR